MRHPDEPAVGVVLQADLGSGSVAHGGRPAGLVEDPAPGAPEPAQRQAGLQRLDQCGDADDTTVPVTQSREDGLLPVRPDVRGALRAGNEPGGRP